MEKQPRALPRRLRFFSTYEAMVDQRRGADLEVLEQLQGLTFRQLRDGCVVTCAVGDRRIEARFQTNNGNSPTGEYFVDGEKVTDITKPLTTVLPHLRTVRELVFRSGALR